jgi:hypothetical protein
MEVVSKKMFGDSGVKRPKGYVAVVIDGKATLVKASTITCITKPFSAGNYALMKLTIDGEKKEIAGDWGDLNSIFNKILEELCIVFGDSE